ncbi:hypothetical protein PUNSTDRAFT_106935 [Punctularia strigosozonata HHB-11173 SS5]|uniref:uncharacterized protein n=1 Tax=Punctularia strigosozonata (strain HHB-11173) TaxID=741275 RepID=UPI0004417C2D|nr:uncharacterized protein PUNSTDRAFT_106935 [Punctularia strigosozonata HHB-11173 SS5]EIN05890.1 hypothetical protein PUNSTDRAFT_106935 [Punctularia strigosozonata HHB-11173 SS5]
MYLTILRPKLEELSAIPFDAVLPTLFRALAHYASPLPTLSSAASQRQPPSTLERRITEILDAMFSGRHYFAFFQALKQQLHPPSDPNADIHEAIQISLGAFRTVRVHVRQHLLNRLTRSYQLQGAGYYSDGLEPALSAPIEEESPFTWDPEKWSGVLCSATEAWINSGIDVRELDPILDEVAGIVKDAFSEHEQRQDDEALDEEESRTLAMLLQSLVLAVPRMRLEEASPVTLPLAQPRLAPTAFLRTLCSILACDPATITLNPPLFVIMLSIAEHLSDEDTSKLPSLMLANQMLSPTSIDWLENWGMLLSKSTLYGSDRSLTRAEVMKTLHAVYAAVKDISIYRRPLADVILQFWTEYLHREDASDDDGGMVWCIMADVVVRRTVEKSEADEEAESLPDGEEFLQVIVAFASEPGRPPAEVFPTTLPTSVSSPIPTRSPSEYQPAQSMALVMSRISSFVNPPNVPPSAAPSQSVDEPLTPPTPPPILPRSVLAVAALVSVFSQLAFTPHVLSDQNLKMAVRVYNILLDVLKNGTGCSSARIAVLQFLMRLRADRDHRLYYVKRRYDKDGHIRTLAGFIGRTARTPSEIAEVTTSTSKDEADSRPARARVANREDRRASRGRGTQPSSVSTGSRSRSRASTHPLPAPRLPPKPREPLWMYPESPPFSITDMDTASEKLSAYDPDGPEMRALLPTSKYLSVLLTIIENEKDWEILSYVLCHFPVQLGNKHLFCGPRSRGVISDILNALCRGLSQRTLGTAVESWPPGLKAGDAQGLAYHTLSILISYRRCFTIKQQHMLVEVLQEGLTVTGQMATIKCCLHALSLAAFEFTSSMTRYLTQIFEKLSQIMSNPEMAVHIINFLSIVGSLPKLHANLTQDDFRLVFGVALQYLQTHNPKADTALTISWALAQHLRIMSYYLVYLWFLNVSLPDRPHHIRFITRQLLLANEGNTEIDPSTEVAFDWLARYTYASADPRPASSVLDDIVMKPERTGERSLPEKSWLLGYTIITIRALPRRGWIAVEARRPSGFTKFLCRTANVPMVGPGDVDPDMISLPAAFMANRDLRPPAAPGQEETGDSMPHEVAPVLRGSNEDDNDPTPPPPDSVTGYVWRGSAPSQRRKDVAIDPSFFPLQLSPYPAINGVHRGTIVRDEVALGRLVRTLERMPVIDTHKVGIMYVAPGQTHETEILRNTHGSPAYTRFLEGLGRLINLRGQMDVYAGNLDPDRHGEYAYAWWDDIGQILFHTATLMPTHLDDPDCNEKKAHIGNDNIRIVWNDSGMEYKFDTLATQFQFVNIVIEPHSWGPIAAYSNNLHEMEYFKLKVQRADGMPEFSPVGDFKLISADSLPLMVRQICLLGDWFASVFKDTNFDKDRVEVQTNWRSRLDAIKRFRNQLPDPTPPEPEVEPQEGLLREEMYRDFSAFY